MRARGRTGARPVTDCIGRRAAKVTPRAGHGGRAPRAGRRRGGFALVIGVDRLGQAEALREHGADVVVQDLGEVAFEE